MQYTFARLGVAEASIATRSFFSFYLISTLIPAFSHLHEKHLQTEEKLS